MKRKIFKIKKTRDEFEWSQIPQPFSTIIRLIAKYWILLLVGLVSIAQKLKLGINLGKTFTIYMLLLILIFGWAFTKQKNRLFQIFGRVVIVLGIYIFLVEFLLK